VNIFKWLFPVSPHGVFGRKELAWFKSRARTVTKRDLRELEKKLMSAISEFVAKQNELSNRVDVALAGIEADITLLKSQVGQITPEDQALLDAATTRLEGVAAKAEAIDALTAPPA